MFKAMLKKECTELAAPFLLAVAFMGVMVAAHVIDASRYIPRGEWMLDADFAYPFLMLSLLLAGVMMCWFILLYLPNWWVLAPLATAGLAAVLVGLVFHVAASRDFA